MHFQGNNEQYQKKSLRKKKVCIEGKSKKKKQQRGNQCFYISFEVSRKLDQNGLFAIDKKPKSRKTLMPKFFFSH